MVLAFRPDSFATFRKLTPRGRAAGVALDFGEAEEGDCKTEAGRVAAKRFSSEKTNAERLSDRRKLRRGSDKREDTFLGLARATLGPFLL